MQYLLAVHTVEGEPMPSTEDMQTQFAQVDVINAELQSAGARVFGGGLRPVEVRPFDDESQA